MKIRAQLFLNNAVVLVILIASSVTANRGSQAVIETAEWVSHTQLVMGNTRCIAKLLGLPFWRVLHGGCCPRRRVVRRGRRA